MALSRFTWLPELKAAREVLLKVSFITSAVKVFPEITDAVRHTPFTATLSPVFRSENILSAEMVSLDSRADFFIAVTVPISSIIPVNNYITSHFTRMSFPNVVISGVPSFTHTSGSSNPVPPTGEKAFFPPSIFGAI